MLNWLVKPSLLPSSTGWARKADAEKYCPVRHVVLRHHLAESKLSSEETFPNMAAHGRCWWVQFSFWYQRPEYKSTSSYVCCFDIFASQIRYNRKTRYYLNLLFIICIKWTHHLLVCKVKSFLLFPFVMCGVWLLEHVIRYIAQSSSLFRA